MTSSLLNLRLFPTFFSPRKQKESYSMHALFYPDAEPQSLAPAKPQAFQPSRRISPLLKAVWREVEPTLHLMHRSGYRMPPFL